jgi:hypothetical protein
MPVNPKKPLFVFGRTATVFWLHTHQTMPLNLSDISKGQKTAAYN